MGKRSTARRLAMQILYQADISPKDLDNNMENILAEGNFIPAAKAFARQLVKGVWQNKKEIDKVIVERSIDWSLPRMSIVDRNILRLAIYELNYEKETPAKVIINEAIEMAKKYSTPKAAKFINGILGGLIKNVG